MGKKLYVGNLAFAVSDRDLRELFAQAGSCESAAIVTDRATGRSRGFGFVTMQSDDDAQKAIAQLNGQDFRGRTLTVSEARERETTRGGRAGGWNGGGRRDRWNRR